MLIRRPKMKTVIKFFILVAVIATISGCINYKETIEDLESYTADLESIVDEQKEKIEELEAKVEDLGSKIDDIEFKLLWADIS